MPRIRDVIIASGFAILGTCAVACDCYGPKPGAKAAEDADIVLEARVADFKARLEPLGACPKDGRITDGILTTVRGKTGVGTCYRQYMIATVDVLRSWKAKAPARVEIRTIFAPACGYHFDVDEDYLIFATRRDDGMLETWQCTGTGPLFWQGKRSAVDGIAELGPAFEPESAAGDPVACGGRLVLAVSLVDVTVPDPVDMGENRSLRVKRVDNGFEVQFVDTQHLEEGNLLIAADAGNGAQPFLITPSTLKTSSTYREAPVRDSNESVCVVVRNADVDEYKEPLQFNRGWLEVRWNAGKRGHP